MDELDNKVAKSIKNADDYLKYGRANWMLAQARPSKIYETETFWKYVGGGLAVGAALIAFTHGPIASFLNERTILANERIEFADAKEKEVTEELALVKAQISKRAEELAVANEQLAAAEQSSTSLNEANALLREALTKAQATAEASGSDNESFRATLESIETQLEEETQKAAAIESEFQFVGLKIKSTDRKGNADIQRVLAANYDHIEEAARADSLIMYTLQEGELFYRVIYSDIEEEIFRASETGTWETTEDQIIFTLEMGRDVDEVLETTTLSFELEGFKEFVLNNQSREFCGVLALNEGAFCLN